MTIKIEQIEKFVREKLKGDVSGHDWYHTDRVRKCALTLVSERTDIDVFVVEAAALLHDVYDHKLGYNDSDREQMVKSCFAGCEDYIRINHITEIINGISYKGGLNRSILSTLEGKYVQDADRLDALGAIGIARTFAFGGARGRALYEPQCRESGKGEDSISHFYVKLLKLKELMNTEEGKKIARMRHEFMVAFLEEFYDEWKGI